LDKALQDIHPQLLVSFIKKCMSVPEMFRQQQRDIQTKEAQLSTPADKRLENSLAALETWEAPEEAKTELRKKFQEELKQARAILHSDPVPASWRIDSAEEFQECLDAQEQDWTDIIALGNRHRDFIDVDKQTVGKMVSYLNDHFGNPRFDLYTLEQKEQAYSAVKAEGKFRTNK
jgi:hypothetical protein